MAGIDWVYWWKLISIFSTGGFGILALLTKYKTDDGTITRWGKISLAGIVTSTLFGAAAQVKESSDKEVAARAAREQTLLLVQETKRSVEGIERTLDKLSEPLDAEMILELPCVGEWKDTCALAKDRWERIEKWPEGSSLNVLLFMSSGAGSDATEFAWSVLVNSATNRAMVRTHGNSVRVLFEGLPVARTSRTSTFKSYSDFSGKDLHANAGLDAFKEGTLSMRPLYVGIAFRDGRRISAKDFQHAGKMMGPRATYSAKLVLDARLVGEFE